MNYAHLSHAISLRHEQESIIGINQFARPRIQLVHCPLIPARVRPLPLPRNGQPIRIVGMIGPHVIADRTSEPRYPGQEIAISRLDFLVVEPTRISKNASLKSVKWFY